MKNTRLLIKEKRTEKSNYEKGSPKKKKQSGDKLMPTNRIISSNWFMISVCIVISLIIFSLGIFLIHYITHLPQLIRNEKIPFNLFLLISKNWIVILFLVFVIAVVNARLIYLMKISFKEYNVNQKGSERFATLKEIQEQYVEIDEREADVVGKGGIPVCMFGGKIYIDRTDVNNAYFGITRSGKGQMFVIVIIDIYSRATIKASLVITDPKLELYASSKFTLQKRGYDVHIINLVDPAYSSSYNPLQLVIDRYKARDYDSVDLLVNSLATQIYSNESSDEASQFYSNTSIALFSSITLALLDDNRENLEKVNMMTIIQFFSEKTSLKIDEKTNGLDKYFDDRPTTDKARIKYSVVRTASEKTKGNAITVFLSKLQVFMLSLIKKMTSNNSIDLNSVGFGDKPQAIFIGMPDYDTSNHFIASLFIRQLYFVLAKNASLKASGRCDRDVVFILDEFGNMPAIEGMSNIMTVCLGRGIKFNLILQSFQQVDTIYGKTAETILENCGNHIYIQTNSFKSSSAFMQAVGNETITNVNRSGERHELDKNITEMYEEKALLNANELMRLKVGENVIKRVMYRKDLKGNDISPYPIFNTGETKFKFAYEFLSKDFPNRSYIELLELENNKEQAEIQVNKKLIDYLIEYKIASSVEGVSKEDLTQLIKTSYELGLCDYEQYIELLDLLEVEYA